MGKRKKGRKEREGKCKEGKGNGLKRRKGEERGSRRESTHHNKHPKLKKKNPPKIPNPKQKPTPHNTNPQNPPNPLYHLTPTSTHKFTTTCLGRLVLHGLGDNLLVVLLGELHVAAVLGVHSLGGLEALLEGLLDPIPVGFVVLVVVGVVLRLGHGDGRGKERRKKRGKGRRKGGDKGGLLGAFWDPVFGWFWGLEMV